MACLRCAGQYKPPVQRATASSAGRSICEPHCGHALGMLKSLADIGLWASTTETTSGITSPARRTMTVSPMRISLRLSSSSLCSVALVTLTPPTNTAFRRATGVIAPVRPTCTVMSSTMVCASSAGYLCAIANLGARDTNPNSFCWEKLFTLYTTPSISNGKLARLVPILA